jgi:hypothetical protein
LTSLSFIQRLLRQISFTRILACNSIQALTSIPSLRWLSETRELQAEPDFKIKEILMTSRLLTLAAALASVGSVSFANNETRAYRLPITRDGVAKERVAYNFWSTEWPGPVVDVKTSVKGSTTIKAYTSLRQLPASTVSCTIKNGIYHPWSHTENSVVNYYTLTAVKSYKALTAFSVDETQYPAGTVVDNVVYASEGYCLGTLKVPGKAPVENDFSCEMVETKDFEALNPSAKSDEFNEQWFYVTCSEGYKAFVSDKGLLSEPGVTEGTFGDYGSAVPATPSPEDSNQ